MDSKIRSRLMAGIRSRDTTPEMRVRRAIFARGLRYRLHRRELPGKPDLVLPKLGLVIFVQGCFWHQHTGCKLASNPKTNAAYWQPKLAGNVARDRRNRAALARLGWRVATIWECHTRNDAKLSSAVDRILKRASRI